MIKILIAEDDKVSLGLIERAVKKFFSDKKIDIFSSESLAEALQISRVRGPMAVSLIDLQLKDSDPANTLLNLRQLGEYVIVMSGVASGATYRECKRHGAKDYIEKPIVIELLCEKLARVLDNREGSIGDFTDSQRRAQMSLTQKTISAPAVVLSPVSSKWLKVILPATGTICVIFAGVIGFVGGSWRTAQAQGAEKQANADTLESIKTSVNELKQNRKEQEQTLLKLQLDVTKLLVKNGLDPSHN